jgi:hypothetical protein
MNWTSLLKHRTIGAGEQVRHHCAALPPARTTAPPASGPDIWAARAGGRQSLLDGNTFRAMQVIEEPVFVGTM